jgi:hypothetical protein
MGATSGFKNVLTAKVCGQSGRPNFASRNIELGKQQKAELIFRKKVSIFKTTGT